MPISRKDLENDLKFYKWMVAQGEEAFHGGNKARQLVSFQNAIKNIEHKLNNDVYKD